jgi:hypothetical protein
VETDDDITQERDRLRRLIAALWRSDTESLSATDTKAALECVAWTIGHAEAAMIDDVEEIVSGILPNGTETETWRLIAYAMEAARDRAVTARDTLLAVATGAAILLACVDETDTHQTEADIVRQALDQYAKVRST